MSGVEWTDSGAPRSRSFDDIYYHPDRGLDESRYTFVSGCDLPGAWAERTFFVIGETGFGTGLNFLASWHAWSRHRREGRRLHYVAVEGFPLRRGELERAHRAFPELAELAGALRAHYPDPAPGFHRLLFDDYALTLDLLVGEVGEVLSELEANVDAWFLDGFAPSRNPQMWRPEVLSEIGRLSASNARLATFTAAGAVRRGLQAAGFKVRKAPGFGTKRERILGRYQGTDGDSRLPAWARCRPAADNPQIVGRGISGWSLARGLARRGKRFTVTDDQRPRASDLPIALVMPRLSADESLPGRLFDSAFAYARMVYAACNAWHECGVLQLADDAAMRARFDKIAATWNGVQSLDADAARDRAGLPLGDPALWLPKAGFVDPGRLAGIDGNDDGDGPAIWATGAGLAQTPVAAVVPMEAYRGQVTLVSPNRISSSLKPVLVAGHYLSPAWRGRHMIGATFDRVELEAQDLSVKEADHARNLAAITDRVPALQGSDFQVTGGWAGIRVAVPDRLPVVGPVPAREAFLEHYAGLRTGRRLPDAELAPEGWTLGAMGARGYTLGPLAAELLISQMLGEPWPLPRSVALLLHPARFLVRDLKRRKL